MERYRQIYACPGDLRFTGRLLLRRGVVLWRRYQAARTETAAAKDAVAAAAAEKVWTAAAVVAMLDSIVRCGSQLIRRGRWLQILADATLYWETAHRGPGAERILSIRRGRIHAITEADAGAPATAPAASRKACRDVFTSAATYDRLRVLTTELRRLVGEERAISVLPAVGGPIGNRGLLRLFNLI